MNVAIVQGRVRNEPDRRSAQDGSLLLSFDVVVAADEGPSQQVPVTWAGPVGNAPTVAEGMVVTVVGHVLRRFYRSGGQTLSRTDIRAEKVVRGAGARAASAIGASFTPSVA